MTYEKFVEDNSLNCCILKILVIKEKVTESLVGVCIDVIFDT